MSSVVGKFELSVQIWSYRSVVSEDVEIKI